MSPPVLYFSTTGTTGAPKHVPLTREFLTRWTNNLLVYWANVVDRFPKVLERDDSLLMLHLAPKPFTRFAAGNIPIHVSTEMPTLAGTGGFPFSRAPWFPPPATLTDVERLYYLLRASIESPLVGIVCLHSSRLQATLAQLQQGGPRLVKDVHDGTLSGAPWSEPNPARARALASLLEQGRFVPRHIWPSLAFVSSWIGASFDLYRPEIERSFTSDIVPQMTVSSEVGHMTMPMGGDVSDGPLTVHTNHYEFRPEDTVEDDGTLSFDELEVGRVYEIIVTTCSGLYRYSCGDQFRVSGHVHGVPTLDFVGRMGVRDIAGEKVTEQHVTAAMKDAVGSCGLELANLTLCATWGRPACYVAAVEPVRGWSEAEQAHFSPRVRSRAPQAGTPLRSQARLRRSRPAAAARRRTRDLRSLHARATHREWSAWHAAQGQDPALPLRERSAHRADRGVAPDRRRMIAAHGIFDFRKPLFEAGDLSSRLIRCFTDAKAYLEHRPLPSILDQVLDGHARARAALDEAAALDHFGMLLPASCKALMSSAATAAGFPLAHAAFPSALFTRELGRLLGQRRLPTSIFKAYGRTARGTALATELFFPQVDEAQAQDWMRRGVGRHLAIETASRSADAIRERCMAAFAGRWAAGLLVHVRSSLFLPTEEVSIVYFDLEDAECPLRLELRVAADVTTEPGTKG